MRGACGSRIRARLPNDSDVFLRNSGAEDVPCRNEQDHVHRNPEPKGAIRNWMIVLRGEITIRHALLKSSDGAQDIQDIYVI
jgi:hypothetical protein